jgi:hypothetical protein
MFIMLLFDLERDFELLRVSILGFGMFFYDFDFGLFFWYLRSSSSNF